MKMIGAFLATFLAAAGLAAAAPGAPAVQFRGAPAPAVGADAAFEADLQAAEGLFRGLARERRLKRAEEEVFLAKGREKVRAFYATAHKSLLFHSRNMMSKMSDPAALVEEGRRLAEEDPASWQAQDYMATGSLAKGNVEEAMAGYLKAIELAPAQQKDWYRNMLATCHRMKNEPEKALALYEQVIASGDNWMALKSAYLSAGIMLIPGAPDKAAYYFDNGMTASTPGERKALLESGICGKFNGRHLPQSCPKSGL